MKPLKPKGVSPAAAASNMMSYSTVSLASKRAVAVAIA